MKLSRRAASISVNGSQALKFSPMFLNPIKINHRSSISIEHFITRSASDGINNPTTSFSRHHRSQHTIALPSDSYCCYRENVRPFRIVAKMLLQELWAIRLDWDDLNNRWTNFAQLENTTTISISRWFGTSLSALAIEVHSFSDASQRALAAVVYVRELDVTLVSAKTKIAPLKSMMIPRLELSAAVFLMRQVLHAFRKMLALDHAPIHF